MTNRNMANAIVCAGYAALSAVALSLTVPVAAQETRQERVAYGDLDLADEAGQATLNKRINVAVKRVCQAGGGSLAEFAASNRCRRDSLASAKAQMEVAIARAGTGRPGIAANMTFDRYPTGKR